MVVLPGALTVYFAFNAGGFFVGSQAIIAVLLLLVLTVRVTSAADPFDGLSGPVALAAAALALYAAWTLASAAWSDAPSRAVLEFDRTLLYLTALVLFGSFARTAERLRWIVRLTALAILVVCTVGLITRILPEVWPISTDIANDRLSYPVTYWNALGLLAALGIIFSLHLASSEREPRAIRVLGSAAVPLLSVALLFTFSRGAILAAALALFTYVVVARPRALIAGLLAVVPTSAVALVVAYAADLLASRHPTSPGAVQQGHRVALAVALCCAGAALLRWLLLRLDEKATWSALPSLSTRGIRAATALLLGTSLAVAVAFNAPSAIGRQYDRFVGQDAVKDNADFRQRLTDPSNSQRLELWGVGLDTFASDPVTGHGAGTFQVVWAQKRPVDSSATDGHSLYLETLGELGFVGFALLVATIATLLIAIATRCRGPDRAVYAAVLAASAAWVLHAGVDWDWELPAVTIWFFALAGTALAASEGGGRLIARPPAGFTRVLLGLGLLVLAVTPASLAASQARLDASADAFRQGDCTKAIDSALSAASFSGFRPEPFEVLGYCDSRLGLHGLAIRAMRSAVERDPEGWEFRYGLALVRAAAGRDPRPAARATLRLNPRGPLARDLVRRFQHSSPASWRKRAIAAPLPGQL